MADPERLLNASSDLDELERELLNSVRRVGPPESAKQQVWDAIDAQIVSAALVAVGTATSEAANAAAHGTLPAAGNAGTVPSAALVAKAGVLSSLVPKLALLVVGSGALVTAAFWMQNRSTDRGTQVAPAPVTSKPARSSEPPSLPSQPSEATESEQPRTEPKPPAALPNVSKQGRASDPLNAESRLLMEARALLRSGDAARAQTVLNRLQREFPKGVLGQEREVLTIEVLSARGNTKAASDRARAFVKAYPNSPHSAKLQRFLE